MKSPQSFTSYRLHFTPLSPIHIGTSESYDPTQYVIEEDVLYAFDTGAALNALTSDDRNALLRITNQKPNADMLKVVQGFFYQRREQLKPFAIQQIPVLAGVAHTYSQRIGQTAQREGNGEQVLNKLEIDRTAYNLITRQPILLGSSLKGAIRTALLDQVNKGQPTREQRGLQEFQGRLFKYRDSGKLHLERDPLRLVHIADATWQGEEGLPSVHVHLAVNRKKHPVKDEQGKLRSASGENLCQTLECIPAFRYRAFSGQLRLQNLNGIPKNDQRVPANRFSIEDIAGACNSFYLPNQTNERGILQSRGFVANEYTATISSLLHLAAEKIRTGQVFLLRVGRHSGAEAVTLNGVRHIKIMQGMGQKSTTADAAKTLWLAAEDKDQRENLQPFGWLLVEVEPLDTPTQEWPELKALCQPHLESAKAFAARQNQQRQAMAEARAKIEQQRMEKAEQAAKLAAMSQETRRVEALKEQLTSATRGKGKGHGLFNALSTLITEATTWPAVDRAYLKATAPQIFEHLNVKKDDYKKLLRVLSEE